MGNQVEPFLRGEAGNNADEGKFRICADEAEGWGECAALAEGTAVDPALAAVEQAAVERGVRRLGEASAARGGRLPAAAEVAQVFGSSPVDRMLGWLYVALMHNLFLDRVFGEFPARRSKAGPLDRRLSLPAALALQAALGLLPLALIALLPVALGTPVAAGVVLLIVAAWWAGSVWLLASPRPVAA